MSEVTIRLSMTDALELKRWVSSQMRTTERSVRALGNTIRIEDRDAACSIFDFLTRCDQAVGSAIAAVEDARQ